MPFSLATYEWRKPNVKTSLPLKHQHVSFFFRILNLLKLKSTKVWFVSEIGIGFGFGKGLKEKKRERKEMIVQIIVCFVIWN